MSGRCPGGQQREEQRVVHHVQVEDYQEHFKTEHVNDILCKDCEFVAKNKDMLKDHMLTTHKGVNCNNCHKKFGDLTLLRKHILANESCMANLF